MKKWVGKAFLIGGILITNFLAVKSLFMVMPAHAEISPGPKKAETIKDWVFSVNIIDTGFTIIDPETGQVHGPFLEGQLGNTNGNFDGAITPDGKTALITNISDKTVYFIDISDPLNPSVMVSVTIPMNAEDIDISSDGKFAMVTGYVSDNISTIDILSHTVVYSNDVTLNGATSVAIAPDNTVIIGNYYGRKIFSSLLLPTGEITHTNSYTCYDSTGARFYPINAGHRTGWPDGNRSWL